MLKTCTKCKRELETSQFYKESKGKYGVMSRCKECFKKINEKYKKDNPERRKETCKTYREGHKEEILIQSKQYRENNTVALTKYRKVYCEEHKEELINYRKKHYIENKITVLVKHKEYNIKNATKNKIYSKKYREENKDEIIERDKKYREENPDKVRESEKRWRESHPDKVKENYEKYYEANPKKVNERNKKCRKENLSKFVIYAQIRRARKQLLPSTFTAEQWEETKIHFNQKCCYCGRELPLQMEHFIPVAKGGGYVKSNIICSCSRCNQSKNDSEFSFWYKNKKYYSKERETKILEYIQLTSAI